MEYAFRTHKEVPFGWVLALQNALPPKPKRERTHRAAPRGGTSGGLA